MNFAFAKRRLMAGFMLLAATCMPVLAGELVSTNDENLALSGYDPVAYFTQSRAVPGNPEIDLEWQDARWQFSSAEHRALFQENPEQYAPRYGGFCAGGMSLGRKTVVDPEAWLIVDGKLFMGGSHGAITYMQKDTDEKIDRADENWKTLGAIN